ncbi:hypothetical protein ACFL6C_02535 [Myxococcota bacterium]
MTVIPRLVGVDPKLYSDEQLEQYTKKNEFEVTRGQYNDAPWTIPQRKYEEAVEKTCGHTMTEVGALPISQYALMVRLPNDPTGIKLVACASRHDVVGKVNALARLVNQYEPHLPASVTVLAVRGPGTELVPAEPDLANTIRNLLT